MRAVAAFFLTSHELSYLSIVAKFEKEIFFLAAFNFLS
jgi:hypothetical protein